ncbi:MAG: isochorismatase family protein [Pseudomonadota bacterium]
MIDTGVSKLRPLIVLDVQRAIDQPVWNGKNNPGYLHVIQALLKHWREQHWPVIHVKHNEAHPASTYHTHGPWNAFKEEVAPLETESVVSKAQNCAFIDTELDALLQTLQAKSFVLVGVVVHNSIDATVRAGKALGYEILLPADGTTAVPVQGRDGKLWDAATVYELSLAILDGEYAQVIDSASLIG